MSTSYGLTVLRNRNFRNLVLSKFFLTCGVQMQGIIVAWQIYRLTRDPLALGLIGLCEAVAFIAFALWAGHLADRVEKRRIILYAQGLLLFCGAGLWGLTRQGNSHLWPMYGLIALTGLARAFLWSSSTSFAEQIIPREIYSSAAAWNSSSWEIATILGPAFGGLLYAWKGPASGYATAVLLMGLGQIFAWRLDRHPPSQEVRQESIASSLLTGIRFVFSHEVILAALTLDMFAVLFGGAVALLPIFSVILGHGPIGLGILRAAPSVGAIIMALYQAYRPPFKNAGRTLLAGVFLFGLCMIIFGLSRNFYFSTILLVLSGMADNISVIMRASILQAATPNVMRGRVSAVNGIFIGSSNEIGAFESGLVAKLMGTIPSVVLGGFLTLVTVALVGWHAPRLRRLKTIEEVKEITEELRFV